MQRAEAAMCDVRSGSNRTSLEASRCNISFRPFLTAAPPPPCSQAPPPPPFHYYTHRCCPSTTMLTGAAYRPRHHTATAVLPAPLLLVPPHSSLQPAAASFCCPTATWRGEQRWGGRSKQDSQHYPVHPAWRRLHTQAAARVLHDAGAHSFPILCE